MYRRYHRSDAFLARPENKLAIGFVLVLLAGFVLMIRYDRPHPPVSAWGPEWDCNRPGGPEGDICIKKSPANSN
jgi:hypothetical protein